MPDAGCSLLLIDIGYISILEEHQCCFRARKRPVGGRNRKFRGYLRSRYYYSPWANKVWQFLSTSMTQRIIGPLATAIQGRNIILCQGKLLLWFKFPIFYIPLRLFFKRLIYSKCIWIEVALATGTSIIPNPKHIFCYFVCLFVFLRLESKFVKLHDWLPFVTVPFLCCATPYRATNYRHRLLLKFHSQSPSTTKPSKSIKSTVAFSRGYILPNVKSGANASKTGL